jgi:hypothetical protein
MDKTIKLLEEFLKDYTMEGVCGFWVEPDEEGEIPSVYIIFDLYWIQSLEISRASFVTRRMRQGLKEDIKNWTGIDVSYVGSIAKKCDNTKDINESISTHLLRRLPFEGMKQDIDNLVDYEINPCEFSDIGDFVGEACDMLVNNYIEELEVSPKEKDDLYIYFVDLFGKHLVNVYKKRCVKGLKESKKRIVVTESQYKRLFEGVGDEINSNDIRLSLKLGFPDDWSEETEELTAGLRNIHTIGDRIGNPQETWSIMNFFDTKVEVREMLNKKWREEGEPNKIEWLISVFTDNNQFLKDLLEKQWNSINVGYKNERQGIKNLIDFISSRGVEFEYEVYPFGYKRDREGNTDITITNKTHSKVSDIQIKSLDAIYEQSDSKWVVYTYGMKNDYKKNKNLGYILYNRENYFVIFKNKNYEVTDKGKKVIHLENPIFQYTNQNTLNEQSKEKQSKKELFQELIDEKLQYIKDSCQDINAETFPSDVGFTSCEFADMIESIDVTEVNMMTGSRTDMYGNMYDTTPSVFIKLMVNYRTVRNYYNFDEIIFDIKYMLRKSTGGLPIVLDYQVNNLKTDKEW